MCKKETWLCSQKKLEAKDVLPNKPHAGGRKGLKMLLFVPDDLDLWPLTLTFKLVRVRQQTRLPCEFGANQFSDSRDIRQKPYFLSVVTLTFDLDIQTRPTEGPSTSSLWIWRKSVQRIPIYFTHKQKSHTQCQKQNLTQFTMCGKYSAKHTKLETVPNINKKS